MFYEIEMDSDELFDLDNLWYQLTAELILYERFDYDAFKAIAVRTFAFLFPYHYEDYLPREMMELLFHINEFACRPYVSKEHKAAMWVAHAFCNQIARGWELVDDDYDEHHFLVEDPYSAKGQTTFIIDAHTFDLSEML